MTRFNLLKKFTHFISTVFLFSSLQLGISIAAQAADCPVLNGKYSKDISDSGSVAFTLHTEIKGSQYYYQLNSDPRWLVADGIPHEIKDGKNSGWAQLTCVNGELAVTLKITSGQFEGFEGITEADIAFKALTPEQIQVRSNTFSFLDGIYSKIVE